MGISKGTIARTAVLLLALTNQILTMCGVNPLPFSDDLIYELATLLFTVAASIWAWWKNNSFTKNAIQADKILKGLNGNVEKSDEIW